MLLRCRLGWTLWPRASPPSFVDQEETAETFLGRQLDVLIHVRPAQSVEAVRYGHKADAVGILQEMRLQHVCRQLLYRIKHVQTRRYIIERVLEDQIEELVWQAGDTFCHNESCDRTQLRVGRYSRVRMGMLVENKSWWKRKRPKRQRIEQLARDIFAKHDRWQRLKRYEALLTQRYDIFLLLSVKLKVQDLTGLLS